MSTNIYLNSGNRKFLEDIANTYVDKTELISFTNSVMSTKNKFMCVTRPRRFGKSITADMLCAYYSKDCDSLPIFEKFKISHKKNWDVQLNKHPVIYVDMQSFAREDSNGLTYVEAINNSVLSELKAHYPNVLSCEDISLPQAIVKIYQSNKEQFVFIIDEWDYVFRAFPKDSILQELYIDFLRQLFKSGPNVETVALAYITGILPIKKYKTDSVLNNFDEYSMLEPLELASSLGFTKEEVKGLCDKNGIDFCETCRWYDGYRLGSYEIFNPRSIMMLVRTKKFQSYWTQTGSFEAVSEYINLNFDGLKDDIISLVNGSQLKNINVLSFNNDLTSFSSKNSVLTLLIHLGYLAYDSEKSLVYLPNEEIRLELLGCINNSKWTEYIEAINRSKELLQKLIFERDAEYVSNCLQSVHQQLSSIMSFNLENDLCITVNNALTAASQYYYQPKRELPSGIGFADLVYIPKKEYIGMVPALVIELKWNKSAQTAIDQIKEKDYCDSIKEYTGNILLVGINYDKDSKKHTCLIEEYSK